MSTSTKVQSSEERKRNISSSILYVSLGAASGTIFLWLASYAFPDGELEIGREVFFNIPKFLQYLSLIHI